MLIADDGIQQQLRQIVRERVYSSTTDTDELLRTELIAYFKPPRILEYEDVRVLLAACPDWFTEKNLARTGAVQELIAARCDEESFRNLMIDALRELTNSYTRSYSAAHAVLEAIKNPVCALAIVRLIPSLRDQSALQKVFKTILGIERK